MELVGAEAAVARAAALLAAFRERSLPVFHVRHLATRPAPPSSCRTPPARRSMPRSRRGGRACVTKHHPNSFRETTLLDELRAADAKSLVFAGMMTHMCVDTTVRAAADLGFCCSLAQDGCCHPRAALSAGTPVDAARYSFALPGRAERQLRNGQAAEELIAAL
jgi:nicotinamidase-related amidase